MVRRRWFRGGSVCNDEKERQKGYGEVGLKSKLNKVNEGFWAIDKRRLAVSFIHW